MSVKDDAARRAVLRTLSALGADFSATSSEKGPGLSKVWRTYGYFHTVPQDLFTVYRQVLGESLPQLLVLDRTGTLRYYGYPSEESVEELIRPMLEEDASPEENP
ncbi:MAG: hypothetical protein D6788_06435 [Planctomycetota bacterium]|nr:MAG: hypothetical protein D6788_06435 [Planctomycetota bacterium]